MRKKKLKASIIILLSLWQPIKRERINSLCGKVLFPKVLLKQRTLFLGENFHTGYTYIESPFHYLAKFFDKELVCSTSDNANLCSTQCTLDKGSIRTGENEIEQYSGILLRMCIVNMPQYWMYCDITSHYKPVAHVMSRDRFETLKGYLDFVDNHPASRNVQDESTDGLFKIQPLFMLLRKNCAIPDEQVYDFVLEGAADSMHPKISKKLGYCGADIALKLTEQIPNNKGKIIK